MTLTPMSFAFPIRVYWEDTDAGGIVFYANYLKFFERARTEWLRSLGIEQRSLRESTGGIFVVGRNLGALSPAPPGSTMNFLLRPRVQESGRASLIIAQQAFLRDGKADARIACFAKGRSASAGSRPTP